MVQAKPCTEEAHACTSRIFTDRPILSLMAEWPVVSRFEFQSELLGRLRTEIWMRKQGFNGKVKLRVPEY